MRPLLWTSLVTWTLVTLVTLVTVVTSSSVRCPQQCSCGSGDELEYSCTLGGGNITVTARIRDSVNIDCEGGALTCSDFPPLPIGSGRPLRSLYVRDCSLPSPLSCIVGRVDAPSVGSLTLRGVRTPLEGRHVEGLGSDVLILFDAGVQKSIPSEAIRSLPSLRHFRLCGGDVSASPPWFPPSPALTYLELAADRVPSLPPDSFLGLAALEKLNLWGNNITDVSEHAFRGLSSLQEVYLSNNRIRSLPPALFTPTPAITTVSITGNFLSTLPAELFQGLHHLKQVTISNNAPLTIQPHTFSNLTITALKLERATLAHLPVLMVTNTTAMVNLTVAHNQLQEIPDGIFDDLSSLQLLDLSYNNIVNVSNKLFAGLKSLRELNMDWNRIEVLPEQLFSGLRHLHSLSMSSNRLHRIHPHSFQGSSLVHVSLSHNSLSLSPLAPPSYSFLVEYSPFNSLLKLQTLRLSHNNISKVFEDWRYSLLELRELDLKYNNYEELNAVDVQFLSSRVVVDLRYNNITTVSLFDSYDDVTITDHHPTTTTTTTAAILLDHNPIHCDCLLYQVGRRLRGARPLVTEPPLHLNDTYCASPPRLKGLKLSEVDLKDFICDVDCPCQCQIVPYTDSLNLDCFNDTVVPDPEEYNLSHSVLKLRRMPKNLTALPEHVKILNLSDIGLVTAPRVVPKTLEVLDLSDNQLEEIPIELLKMNLTLELSGNMFLCDCSTIDEISMMNKYSNKIIDWQRVKCQDGSLMWRIEVEKLCLVQRAAVLGGVLAAFGIILAALAVIIHRYSIEIRIFLTNRGLLCCFVDEYDASKQYDVFVSFAHDDEKFVIEKLLPKLEVNYKVCVHHRDWKVGDLIPTQIARSVEESRRTLIVLSKHFLSSTWGMLEFRAAHVQALREKKVRVIVLLLEDLTDVEIDAELRAYLTTNTYIKWGDQWFWEKLQYALPKRTRAKDVRSERRAKLAADSMARGGLHVTLTQDGKLVNNVGKDLCHVAYIKTSM